jgi:hypothetical protein
MITAITEANMRETTRFTSRFALVVAFVTVAGTSAFADHRHPQTTGTRDEARASIVARDGAAVTTPAGDESGVGRQRDESPRAMRSGRSDRGVHGRDVGVEQARPVVVEQDRSDRVVRGRELPVNRVRPGAIDLDRTDRAVQGREGAEAQQAVADRNRSGEVDRSENRGHGYEQRGHGEDAGRNGRWGRDQNRYSNSGAVDHGKRAPYYAHGQVSKVRPYNNGYRVWIHGSPYPYFVPSVYWRPGYFNVGMTVRVGGYYNPSGYYDYYGDYECNTIAEKRMRGVVEYVDYRRGELLLDVDGGGEVTVELRDRYEHVHEGDYVMLYGDWNRWGRFVALDVDVIDRDYRW